MTKISNTDQKSWYISIANQAIGYGYGADASVVVDYAKALYESGISVKSFNKALSQLEAPSSGALIEYAQKIEDFINGEE